MTTEQRPEESTGVSQQPPNQRQTHHSPGAKKSRKLSVCLDSRRKGQGGRRRRSDNEVRIQSRPDQEAIEGHGEGFVLNSLDSII